MSLHNKGKGKRLSEEARRKIGEVHKCKRLSEEWRKKISEAHKGKPGPWLGKHLSEETKRKLSEAHRGRKPPKSTIEAVKKANTGKHWFTNGIENRFCFECPEGFVKGKICHVV